MKKAERVIRSILGPTRKNICSLIDSVDIACHLMFEQKIPMDDILVTKDIYCSVAEQLQKSENTVTKGIERLSHACWDELVKRRLVERYIGEPLADLKRPSDMIFYLAYYTEFDLPFFVVIREHPELLF